MTEYVIQSWNVMGFYQDRETFEEFKDAATRLEELARETGIAKGRIISVAAELVPRVEYKSLF